ncbi:MAG TPA: hypothetical protein VEI06_03520 [Gemmatimonadaceae bacterium]|nr:hypothetical protein [Gemmatimonadaceae bacterium]
MAQRMSWAVLMIPLLAGCTTTTSISGSPAILIKRSGDNQTGPVNTLLRMPVIAEVVNGSAVPLQGVTVTFTVVSGGGSTSDQTVTTDVNGDAQVRWVLGATVGDQDLRASVVGVVPVDFTATATPAVGSRAP